MVNRVRAWRRRLFPLAAALACVRLGVAQEVPVICYHDISGSRENEMTTTPRIFDEQMRYLKEEGYTTLGMDELVEFMQGKRRIPEKSIVLTFDDGYEGVYRYAFPELQKLGFKATLFLVVAHVGDTTRQIPHLTWNQVAEMDCSGTIEAEVHCGKLHTFMAKYWSEPQPGSPTRVDMAQDLLWAKQTLADKLGREVRYLAWPQGSYNDELIQLAQSEGYGALLTGDFGLNCEGDDLAHIKRIGMSSRTDTLRVFREKLQNAYTECSKLEAEHHGAKQ